MCLPYNLIKYCSLFVTLIWMANSLVNRPDDGGRWDEVRDSSSVHNWSDDGSYVAVWPLLAHFLHSLKFETGRPPKMSGYRSLSMKAILFACSKATEMDLHRAVVSSSSSDGIAGEDEIPNETVQEARRTYSTAGANPDDSEGDDPEERPRPITRTQQLTDILCDLPCQMFQKAPVCTATKTSWSVITPSMAAKRPRIFEQLATLEVGFPNRYVFENNWTLWENTVNSLSYYCRIPGRQTERTARPLLPGGQVGVPGPAKENTGCVPRRGCAPRTQVCERPLALAAQWTCKEPYLEHRGMQIQLGTQGGALNGGPWIVLKPQDDGFALP
ncbi:hypothetical protein RhiLY_14509 [Ceratobasidium sp. AG-Ba]|nr:hypothetical protein RhiLY_14509 [Ceratobasidium sp. AG-Ba]